MLREYRALRMVIAQFTEQQAALLHLTPSVGELFELTDRLDAAIDVLLKTTVDTFVAEHTETISQHTLRLESFYRMLVKSAIDFSRRANATSPRWTSTAASAL